MKKTHFTQKYKRFVKKFFESFFLFCFIAEF